MSWSRLASRGLAPGCLLYAAFLPALQLAPYLFPTDPTVASVAAVKGYNNAAAHLLLVGLAAAGILACALLERAGYFTRALEDAQPARPVEGAQVLRPVDLAGIVFVAVATLALYFPWFLAKHGPYAEDSYFLSVFHRLAGGQRPYAEFEFLYGPLMLGAGQVWLGALGFSMRSYYLLIATLEALQYVLLALLLQRAFRDRRRQGGYFILLAALLFNSLLGLNSNGLRRLLPILAVLLVACRPRATAAALGASVLLGVSLTYSHDFGLVGLVAVIAVYALIAVRERRVRAAALAALTAALSLVLWIAMSRALLGDSFTAYLESARYVVGRFGHGEQSFPFYWTVNSLAIFGLLAVAVTIVGRGLGRSRSVPLASGDLALAGALVFALVGLKSGLNRADVWHLVAPILCLAFAFVLPWPRALFTYSARAHRGIIGLLVVVAGTYLFALLPTGSYMVAGLARGFLDAVAGSPVRAAAALPATEGLRARGPTIERERSQPSPDIVAMANHLASDTVAGRPVVMYGTVWSLDKRLGVYSPSYVVDDFLLSEDMGLRVQQALASTPDALVVIDRASFGRLNGEQAPFRRFYLDSRIKRVAGWLSTVHFRVGDEEYALKLARWDRTVGAYLAAEYRPVARFGDLVLLERAATSGRLDQP